MPELRSLARVGLALLFLLGACTSTKVSAPAVGGHGISIAQDLVLTLPQTPGAGGPGNEAQTIVGTYDGKRRVFQASISRAEDALSVTLIAIAGPRILEIAWNGEGIAETRYPYTPDGLSGINVLADMFLTSWPEEDIRKALPAGARLDIGPARRQVFLGDKRIVDIQYDLTDAKGRTFTEFSNLERDYQLSIYLD